MVSIAVVILNWNGAGFLRRFLPGVLRHSQGAEVWVADNGSTDGSLGILAAEFPAVRTLGLGANHGFAGGYNRALAAIEARYYVLLNSDVEVSPGWLGPVVGAMEADPRVAAAQPKVRALADRRLFEYAGAAGGFVDALGYPYCRGRVLGAVEEDRGQYDTPADVLWATGAAMFVRADAFRQAGGFDERFFAHMEEIDLCWRLRDAGHRVVCVPSSVVYHMGGGSLPAGNPRKVFLNYRNNLLMLWKNLPAGRLARVLSLRLPLDAAASLAYLAQGRGRSFAAVWRGYAAAWRMRRRYAPDRRRLEAWRGMGPGCVALRYYLRRQRTYSQIVGQ